MLFFCSCVQDVFEVRQRRFWSGRLQRAHHHPPAFPGRSGFLGEGVAAAAVRHRPGAEGRVWHDHHGHRHQTVPCRTAGHPVAAQLQAPGHDGDLRGPESMGSPGHHIQRGSDLDANFRVRVRCGCHRGGRDAVRSRHEARDQILSSRGQVSLTDLWSVGELPLDRTPGWGFKRLGEGGHVDTQEFEDSMSGGHQREVGEQAVCRLWQSSDIRGLDRIPPHWLSRQLLGFWQISPVSAKTQHNLWFWILNSLVPVSNNSDQSGGAMNRGTWNREWQGEHAWNHDGTRQLGTRGPWRTLRNVWLYSMRTEALGGTYILMNIVNCKYDIHCTNFKVTEVDNYNSVCTNNYNVDRTKINLPAIFLKVAYIHYTNLVFWALFVPRCPRKKGRGQLPVVLTPLPMNPGHGYQHQSLISNVTGGGIMLALSSLFEENCFIGVCCIVAIWRGLMGFDVI